MSFFLQANVCGNELSYPCDSILNHGSSIRKRVLIGLGYTIKKSYPIVSYEQNVNVYY